jgi:asparagine synthase (glutamine-hydrolysing)
MCGILGIVEAAGAPEGAEEALGRGLSALSHRGPDAHGAASVATAEAAAHLGHARLAILDLSEAAAQPMARRDGRYTLVFNGEVYNFRQIRGELEALGAAFVSDGDTEVVLEALIHWGEAALARFVGMFALALWDRDTSTLLLARDRLGIKPLYLRVDPDRRRLAFASEGQALARAGLATPRRDAAALHGWGHLAGCEDPETLLGGVVQLGAGEWMRWKVGERPTRRTWWRPEPARARASDPLPALAAALDEAVSDRLVSDVPLGVFLSGGVDSAAIAALAARHVRERLETFTLAFGEAAYDERDRAARIARHLGVRHHVAVVSPDEALAAVAPAFDAQDFPSHDGVNTWLVSRAARQAGLVVCLSGTGGDELFGGYRHFHDLRALLAVGRAGRLLPPGVVARLGDAIPASAPTRLRKTAALLETRGEPAALARLVRQVFSPAQRRALFGPDPRTAKPEVAPAMADPVTALSVAELTGYLRDTQLRDIDVMSMAHGLEVRVPLLDHRVVALALALPASLRRPQRGLNKPALVAAAGLPEDLLRAPKMGFTLPWEDWLRGPLRGFAEASLFDPSGAPVSESAMRGLWRDFLAHRPNVNATRVLGLISLCRWYRRRAADLSA